MPACPKCGSNNPAGAGTCQNCAASLTNEETYRAPTPPKPPPKRAAPPPPPPPPPKSGFQWIPWGQLSSGQKLGRAVALAVAVLVVFLIGRSVFRLIAGGSPAEVTSPAQPGKGPVVAMSDVDHAAAIVSLCKVFQIYGMPKDDNDAYATAKNASEMFKTIGDHDQQASMDLFAAVATEFSTGHLTDRDCAAVGQPMPTQSTRPQ